MRILTIANCPPLEHLGSGYVIANYARGLRERGHDVRLFAPEDYEPFQSVAFATGYKKAFGMAALALREVARRRYDVVEFYGAECWLAASILNRLPWRNFLLVHHSNGLETYFHEAIASKLGASTMAGRRPRWYQRDASRLFARSFARVDALVTVSQADAKYAVRHSYQRPESVLAIENPLPDEYLGRDVRFDRPLALGFCGSWIDRKGIDLIRSDVTRLLDEFEDLRVTLVGVGEAFDAAANFPERVISRVDVVPFVREKSKLRQLYESISILLVPSYYESFGLVSAEGMASGCALVATKVGFAADLAPDREAILLDEPESPRLYAAARRLVVDDDLRRRVAEHGYARVQSLRWPDAVDRLESQYASWLGAFRSRDAAEAASPA